jgi:hypothetical protein
MTTMPKALTTSHVTARDPKGLRFMEKVEAAFNKSGLSEEEAQRINEAPGLNDHIAEFIEKFRNDKFALLVDLGTITVPDDYVHGSRLTTFGKEHRKEFYYYNDAITDGNFPNPTRVLKPGDKLRVRAYKQIVPGETTSEERMAFLATQKAVLVGAQGASLVYEQKRKQLPKGKWYVSFDEKDRLWQDAGGGHGVPGVGAHSDGGFYFDLGRFEYPWSDGSVLLCFCDE